MFTFFDIWNSSPCTLSYKCESLFFFLANAKAETKLTVKDFEAGERMGTLVSLYQRLFSQALTFWDTFLKVKMHPGSRHIQCTKLVLLYHTKATKVVFFLVLGNSIPYRTTLLAWYIVNTRLAKSYWLVPIGSSVLKSRCVTIVVTTGQCVPWRHTRVVLQFAKTSNPLKKKFKHFWNLFPGLL